MDFKNETFNILYAYYYINIIFKSIIFIINIFSFKVFNGLMKSIFLKSSKCLIFATDIIHRMKYFYLNN